MFLWVLMLVVQAWLIRSKQFNAHRWVGRSSYVIAPLIIVSGLATLQHEFSRTLELARADVIGFGMLLAFGLAWTLAIVHKDQIQRHMRYMISTVFAIASAIVFRILINWVPGFETVTASIMGNAVAHFIPLALLIALDWRGGIKRSPFWAVTLVLAVAHLGYWTFANTQAWLDFCRWYGGLI
jgi:hypothetical protein